MSVPGFPNLFSIYGPNTNLGGSSIIAMMEAQAGYVAEVARRIGELRAEGSLRLVAPSEEALRRWDTEIQGRLGRSTWATCDSWYSDGDRITTNWPGTVKEYQRRLAEVDWDDLETTGIAT